MDLMKLATQLFMQKMGSSNLNEGTVSAALGALLGGGDGQIDLGSILSKLDGGGLASMAQSWLGDGSNDSISAGQITDLFGSSALGDFAGKLGLEQPAATDGLAKMLPDLMDQSSSGGSLLDAIGGASGALGMASKLFK